MAKPKYDPKHVVKKTFLLNRSNIMNANWELNFLRVSKIEEATPISIFFIVVRSETEDFFIDTIKEFVSSYLSTLALKFLLQD